jgi:hypothetical protein
MNLSDILRINKYIKIYILCVLCICWIIVPLYSVFTLFLFLGLIKTNNIEKYFYLFLIAVSLGLVNFTRYPESDLHTYYETFNALRDVSIYNFSQVVLLDPAFYFLSTILSHLVDGYGPYFSLFWTTIIYYIAFIAILSISKELNLSIKWTVGILSFTAFVGYNFMLTSHLVRQYVAMSFLILSFILLIRERKNVYLFFIISFLMHHSAIIFFPIIYIIKNNYIKNNNFFLYTALFLIISFIIGNENILLYLTYLPDTSFESMNFIIQKSYILLDKNDGDLRLRAIIEILTIFILVAIVFFKDREYALIGLKILYIYIFFFSLLIIFRNTDLLLLRYSFYSYGITIIALPYIVKKFNIFSYFLLSFLILSAPLRFIRVFENSGWTYIENSKLIIGHSLFDFLSNGFSI